jgi:hypothetical protein
MAEKLKPVHTIIPESAAIAADQQLLFESTCPKLGRNVHHTIDSHQTEIPRPDIFKLEHLSGRKLYLARSEYRRVSVK